MIISLAETFFILIIISIVAVSAYLSWLHILPRLPVRVPPVLVCIALGCSMRMICKPLLESPSADAFLDADAKQHPMKGHIYGEGVVRSISSPVISLCLSGVGILIGSHIDLPFLKQHTRALVSLTLCVVVLAYCVTFAAATLYTGMNVALLPFIHLVSSTAIERSSGEALATISDVKSLSSAHSSVVFFAKSTIFLGAALDICSVVVFVLSLAMIQSSGSDGIFHVIEIFSGTVFLAVLVFAVKAVYPAILSKLVALMSSAANVFISSSNSSSSDDAAILAKDSLTDDGADHALHSPSHHREKAQQQQQSSSSSSSSVWIQIAHFFTHLLTSSNLLHERDTVMVLTSLSIGSHLVPSAELLLAAVAVGMRLSFLAKNSGSAAAAKDDDHTAASASPASVITVVDSQAVLVYAVLFGIIGFRLDASQLLDTLLAAPRFAMLLFSGRMVGLVLGGLAGAALGNSRAHMRWRGLALVTRIAVSIILLQKMEDALPSAKPIVHASIGAVFLDMCVGPPLLQFVLRRIEAEAAAVSASTSALATGSEKAVVEEVV